MRNGETVEIEIDTGKHIKLETISEPDEMVIEQFIML